MQIFVVKTDGSGLPKRLTHNPPDKWRPAWSPDGDTIAYVSIDPFQNETIHLMTADGQHLKRLGNLHQEANYDPDWFDPATLAVPPANSQIIIWGRLKRLGSNARSK